MSNKKETYTAVTPTPIYGFPMKGTYLISVERRTPGFSNFGTTEHYRADNAVVLNGLTMLARWISSYAVGVNSQMAYIAVGTATTAASVNQTNLAGEVKRLPFSAVSVTANNSWSAVSTFGGGTDSIVGVVIGEAGVWNAAGSGAGVMFNRAPLSATFTLQSSDVAAVQVIVSVGSL
jgi:hypothetical protein